ncbi:hypothetical protein [Sorangium sp. So ce394]|uniref:hypothetical protein n=1 Tax=Sorangium sp. So ce394 TaxID=3133310 RepID=UPI003F5B4E8C
MKISAMVSTLVGVSLCAGVAFAEGGRASREPRHLQVLRARGDIVDRVHHRAPREPAAGRHGRAERAEPIRVARGHAQERIRCSDMGADCSSRAAAAHRSRTEARADAGRRAAAQPSQLRSKAESRINCSDAGECTASSAGARRAWAGRSAGAPAAQGKERAAAPRDAAQRQSPRMACNEGEECAMSSKEAAKFWAAQAIKAGTKSPSQIASERSERARRAAERQRERDAQRARSDAAAK